jgi:hypothetical protein
LATVHYVDLNGTNATPPYTNWMTAATNIQVAIDAAAVGDIILVSNGVYGTGGSVVYGAMTNRVAVNKAVTVQSVNGPAVTIILGYTIPAGGYGDSAVRCVFLTNNAQLIGFTLTNGATRSAGDFFNERSGGGVRGSASSVVSNCVIVGNSAYQYGGGAYIGTLNNCVLIGNLGGTIGGGASSCNMNNCLVISNIATTVGGVDIGTETLNNCTIVGNTGINAVGGVDGINLNNCIVYDNTAPSYPNYQTNSAMLFNYCCTTPLPTVGFGPFPFIENFTNAPQFVNEAAGDFRLQSNSPCINAGNNGDVSVTNDFAGNPRIAGGTVDVGAYEYQTPASVLSYVWAQQYGLPTDGSADFLDPDGDGMNNWQEWKAGTYPTNAASVLRLAPPSNSVSGLVVTWQSVTNVTYYLQRSTSLPAFASTQSNLVGQAGTTSYTDSTATNGGPYFYRVGVQ